MEEVAKTLNDIGVEPIMAEAIARRQEWGGNLNLAAEFEGKARESYRDVIRAIADKANR